MLDGAKNHLVWVHKKTKPINFKGVVEKTEEQLDQNEDPLAALQWKVSQTVYSKFLTAFQFTKQGVDTACSDLMRNITPLYFSYYI